MNRNIYITPYKKKRGISERIKGYSAVSILIALTVVVSLVQIIFTEISCDNGDTECIALDYFALKPTSIANGQFLWTLITHMFSHGGIFHLFINMFVLFSLGALCERIIGKKRFVWFYILSGVFAGILSVALSLFYGDSYWGGRIFGTADVYMLGASGAIFAIAGLFVMLLPRLRFSIIFLPFFSLPAYVMVPLVLFLTWLASAISNLPIGNVAHFGGFLAGIIYGYYLRMKYREKVMLLQRMFR